MNRTVHTRFASFTYEHSLRMLILLATLLLGSIVALAQTTAFTYQGRLTDGGNPANGNYDLQVKLFDALTGGNQIGATASLNTVAVTNGVFTVTLDFGAAAFSGANRWAEISARPAGGANFTTLTPRQPVTSTPYAIKSLSAATADGLSATCTGCITSAQIGSLPSTSGNYIQNTTTQQANTNFNISGNGILGGDVNAGKKIVVDSSNVFDGNFSSNLGGLKFGSGNTGEGIGSKRTAGGNAFGLDFFTSYTARLSIANNGNVGIGTSAPTDKLQISDFSSPDTSTYLKIATKGTNVGTPGDRIAGIKLKHFDDTYGFSLEAFEGQTLAGFAIKSFVANATGITRFFIDEGSGNVGIGTTAPGSLLTLKASSNTAPALEVNQGAIKVTGAGLGTNTPVFIQEATASNIDPTYSPATVINHPLTNGDVKAILIVTPVQLPGRGTVKSIYVDYNTAIGRWRIIHADFSPMTVGESFNVLVVKP
ncbi:MAG TPA: hypothetical protein PLK30_10245 [Blastocatellia bacterium]|nr:hypothetical protein [Blastocatellia bacterium]